ncbi:galactose-specific lectin nattectin-like [Dunckerocampus dactyliophorus]|uniref:galactose-specific lectin nattectin-like n=1 Tax=Dunckerocampus dactyliophorus TaxID=161453 RepID=UPI0024071BC2|nr:galactose-specific lectin nattectin-like [Dunckerocampus dactyliophorus]
MALALHVFFVLCGISGVLTGAWSWRRHKDKDACCPEGWTQLDDHCYIFQYEVRPFADAERVCKILGGNLASIHNYLENVAVAGLIKDGGADFAWIGLHDAIEKGHYFWTDGKDFDFDNFALGKPDGTGACVELYAPDQTFFDEDCTVYHPYVCARDTYYCGSH